MVRVHGHRVPWWRADRGTCCPDRNNILLAFLHSSTGPDLHWISTRLSEGSPLSQRTPSTSCRSHRHTPIHASTHYLLKPTHTHRHTNTQRLQTRIFRSSLFSRRSLRALSKELSTFQWRTVNWSHGFQSRCVFILSARTVCISIFICYNPGS